MKSKHCTSSSPVSTVLSDSCPGHYWKLTALYCPNEEASCPPDPVPSLLQPEPCTSASSMMQPEAQQLTKPNPAPPALEWKRGDDEWATKRLMLLQMI